MSTDLADEYFGKGFLTDQQRSEDWLWTDSNNRFHFKTRRDLKGGIEIFPQTEFTLNQLLLAQGEFMASFMIFTFPRLNGFSGADCLEWRLNNPKRMHWRV